MGLHLTQENFQISLERQLPGKITLTAAYIGNTGVHIPSFLSPTTDMPPQYLLPGQHLLHADGHRTVLLGPQWTNPSAL